jgi:hypothetical protein
VVATILMLKAEQAMKSGTVENVDLGEYGME